MKAHKASGYSLVELLLALIIGSVVMAGTYTSYLIASKNYQVTSALAEVQEMGIPTLQIVVRNVRLAGHKALDATMQSPFGVIAQPITITDSGNACCDIVQIIYDTDTATRQRIRYYVLPRINPVRNALYMDRDLWDGMAWNNTANQSLVADYIEDFQLVGSNPNSLGQPTLVDISMTFRNKNVLNRPPVAYQKPVYDVGNFALAANDSYHRDEFNATVNIRNLRELIY